MEAERGREFWRQVFGREGHVEVEIGPGTGSFLLSVAQAHPEVNFLGIEASRRRATRLEQQVVSRGLGNVVVLYAPAQCVLAQLIPALSVAAFHIYFPDPWWKRRHQRRRLLTPELVASVERVLVPEGKVFFATDVDLVWQLALSVFATCASLRPDPSLQPVRPVPTHFETKAMRRGAMVRDLVLVKRPGALLLPGPPSHPTSVDSGTTADVLPSGLPSTASHPRP